MLIDLYYKHTCLIVPKVFISVVGNGLLTMDYSCSDALGKKLKLWIDAGIEEIYFFMHMHDEGKSHELIHPSLNVFFFNT